MELQIFDTFIDLACISFGIFKAILPSVGTFVDIIILFFEISFSFLELSSIFATTSALFPLFASAFGFFVRDFFGLASALLLVTFGETAAIVGVGHFKFGTFDLDCD